MICIFFAFYRKTFYSERIYSFCTIYSFFITQQIWPPTICHFHSGNEIVALIYLHVIYKYENQFQTKTKHHLFFFVTQQITGVIYIT